jgi:hypothetical protein
MYQLGKAKMHIIYEVKQKGLDSVQWSWRGDDSEFDLKAVADWESRGFRVHRINLKA